MVYVLGGCQLLLALVFLLAATGKLLDPRQFLAGLRVSGVPSVIVHPLAVFIVASEVLLAMSLVFQTPVPLRGALIGTLLVLGLFTGWLLWVRMHKLSLGCGCFGQGASEVSIGNIVRNLVFLAIAAATLLFATRIPSLSFAPSPWMLLVSLAATISSIVMMIRRLYEIARYPPQRLPHAT